jgi:hypothetical protein
MLVNGKNITKVLEKYDFKIEDWDFLETMVSMEGWNGNLNDLDRILADIVNKYEVF